MTTTMSSPPADPDPAAAHVAGRGWAILLVSLMVAACLVALVATALYLTGSFITSPPIPDFTR